MIELRHASFRYEQGGAPSVSDINMRAGRGECVLLCGRSGCGKTTVTKMVNGIIPQLCQGELDGSVEVGGKDVAVTPPHALSRFVSSVFQNPKSQFFNLDVESELTFALENQGLSETEIEARLEEATVRLGISKLRGREMFELSGGEKQLVAIAAAYMMRPELLVLDEPTANLDLESTRALRLALRSLKGKGVTILIAEHRFAYLSGLVDRAVYMEDGRIIKEFSGEEFFSLPSKERMSLGLRRLSDEEEAGVLARRGGCDSFMKVRGLGLAYGRKRIAEGIAFTASKGDIIGLVGRNGAGKTTLCRTLCGLHDQMAGNVLLEGVAARRRERLRSSYIVMQDVNHQLFGDSVLEEMRLGTEIPDEERVRTLLEDLDLECYAKAHPLALSGGQKQRLAIAVGLLQEKTVYVFDEPSSGLDYASMCAIRGQIRDLAERGCVVLLVTHDMELLDTLCNRCLFLEKDRVVELFPGDDSFSRLTERMLLESG